MCRLSSAVSSFNRSVANSPSATIIRASALPPSAEFQSLSREKPFCHGGPRERASRPRRTACREFQSLSREKPFCHTGQSVRFNRSVAKSPSATSPPPCDAAMNPARVSIAQSRKALLPHEQCKDNSDDLPTVSIAQSRKALLPPDLHNCFAGQSRVSIAQSRKALLPL